MPSAGRNRAALDLLLAGGVIDAERHRTLLTLCKTQGERSEEVLLEHGVFREEELLSQLARLHRTQYVLSARGQKLEPSAPTLKLLSPRVAAQELVFPLRLDSQNGTLQVLTADPDDEVVLRAAQLASGARHVQPILARPALLRALIARHYEQRADAFEPLRTEQAKRLERARASGPSLPRGEDEFVLEHGGASFLADSGSVRAVAESPVPPAVDAGWLPLIEQLVRHAHDDAGDWRDHPTELARCAVEVGRKLELRTAQLEALHLACLVHDVGKPGARAHLTLLRLHTQAEAREHLLPLFDAPLRRLPWLRQRPQTALCIEQQYERFDGRGGPRGLAGEGIELGARILSACDAYLDLLHNAHNPYGARLPVAMARQLISQSAESLFDPRVLAQLLQLPPPERSASPPFDR